MRIALVQLDVSDTESVDARISRTLTLVDAVAAARDPGIALVTADDVDLTVTPQLIVLPELWPVGAFDMGTLQANPQSIDGPLVASLSAIARERSVWLHGGSFPEVDAAGALHNTSVLFNPEGELVATYRKLHLFGFAGGESEVLTAGDDVVLIDSPAGTTGLSTCYDLRFPELYRQLVVAGAEAFVIASGWPLRRIDHWRTLVRARSIENQAWTFAANCVGEHADTVLGGRSVIVDPWGNVIVDADDITECVVLADVDPAMVAKTRAQFPVLADRRL